MAQPSQNNLTSLPPEVQWGVMKENPLGGSKPFDLLTDALIPLGILGMVWSFTCFLIEVRSVLTRMGDELLRWVFFWFLLAIVLISLIRRKHGSNASAGALGLGLAFAMVLFVLRFTVGAGSLTGAAVPVVDSLFFNFVLVGVAWWAINKLTDECTAEEGIADETSSGLLGKLFKASEPEPRASASDQPARGRVRHPGRLVMLFGLGALVVFGFTQRFLAAGGDEAMRRGFWWMVGYAFCSLAVLALTSLSGLRMYVKKRGVTISRGVAPLWISISALVIACILLVAWVAKLATPTVAQVADITKIRIARGTPSTQEIQTDSSLEGIRQPKGQPTHLKRMGEGEGHVGEENPQPSRTSENPQQTPQGSSGAGKRSEGASGTQGSTAKGSGSSTQAGAGQGGQGKSQNPTKKARGGGGSSEQGEAKNQPQQSEAQSKSSSSRFSFSLKTGFPWWLLLLLLLLLLILYLLWKNRDKIKRQLAKLRYLPQMVREWLALWAARLAALWARLLAFLRLPGWVGRAARNGSVKRKKFTNPFANKRLLNDLSPKELVEHTYLGLLDYAEYVDCPRKEHQTPYEYARLLPQPLEHLKNEVITLTQLYVQASYTPQDVTREHVLDLESIWDKLSAEVQAALTKKSGR